MNYSKTRIKCYFAKWFNSIWIFILENQIDIDLIFTKDDAISIRFNFEFYRFEFEDESFEKKII
jgi:hypothetical protein